MSDDAQYVRTLSLGAAVELGKLANAVEALGAPDDLIPRHVFVQFLRDNAADLDRIRRTQEVTGQ